MNIVAFSWVGLLLIAVGIGAVFMLRMVGRRGAPLPSLPPAIVYFIVGCAAALYLYFAFTTTGTGLQTLLLVLVVASVGAAYAAAGRESQVSFVRSKPPAPRVSSAGDRRTGWTPVWITSVVGLAILTMFWFKASSHQTATVDMAIERRHEAQIERQIVVVQEELDRLERSPSPPPKGTAAVDPMSAQREQLQRSLEALQQRQRRPTPAEAFQEQAVAAPIWSLGLIVLIVFAFVLVIGLTRRQITERLAADLGHPTHGSPSIAGRIHTALSPLRRAAVTEIIGSLFVGMLAAVVLSRLLLVMRSTTPSLEQWAWLTVTTAVGTASVLLTETLIGRLDVGRHPGRRRLLHAVGGCVVGAASWYVADYLRVALPFEYGVYGVDVSQWAECYDTSLKPLAPAFVGYFGLTYFLTAWWHNLPRGRSRHATFDFSDAVIAVLWAGAVHLIFPFPQPWGLLAQGATVLTIQFAAPRTDDAGRQSSAARRGAA